ncbi:Mov34/MPN/PAD-1 family protein [uncultured Winogradskyella sp.]|uniref:Mov34/MPN/PAD-1 family protein n=1 Tax=uncultured Winogradskyella sp. TaxID=395353 RepID=UPI00262EC476|nr:Mov34/MPN/PAD-1 family protein [uncultured Winogradskyella sp.]
MIYAHKHYKIIIEDNVLNLFKNFKQTGRKHERGGILLGEVSSKEIRIKRASIPTVFDSSSRFSFNRNKKSAQIITDYEYNNSNGKIIYLGEWHTHPEKKPSPSSIDCKMISNQFRKNKINEWFLLMIIVGLDDMYVSFYDGKSNTELKKITN